MKKHIFHRRNHLGFNSLQKVKARGNNLESLKMFNIFAATIINLKTKYY